MALIYQSCVETSTEILFKLSYLTKQRKNDRALINVAAENVIRPRRGISQTLE